MAGKWETVSIQSLIESGAITGHKDGNHGNQYPRIEEFGSSGVPFLTAKSLSKGWLDIDGAPRLADDRAIKLRLGFVKPRDVLLSHNATIGRVGIVPEFNGRLLIGTSLTYFRLDETRILPRYLAAYFSGTDFQNQLAAVMSHTTRNQIPISAQRRLRIAVPPIAEQKAIVAALGALVDKIELNRRMNATLEAMARALFQSWFVDFDPVRVKLDDRLPMGMNNQTDDLFPDAFEHVGNQSLPRGWELVCLEELLSSDRGISVGVMYPGDHCDGGVPLIKAGDLSGSVINRQPDFCISLQKHEEYRRTEFRGGEILMTLVGNIGQCAIVPDELKGWNAARAVGVIRLESKDDAVFVRLALQSTPVQFLMQAWANTTVQPTLNLKEIRQLPIVFPPMKVRNTFTRLISPIYDQIDRNQRETATLATLRDTLLPKLLSGELSVKEAIATTQEVF